MVTTNDTRIENLIDADGSVFPSDLHGYAAGAAAVDLLEHWATCDPPLDKVTKIEDVAGVIAVLTRWKEALAQAVEG